MKNDPSRPSVRLPRAGMTRRSALGAASAGAAALALAPSGPARAAESAARILAPAWGTVLVPPREPFTVPQGGQLVRPVRSSLAGPSLAIELANRHGTAPLVVRQVRISRAGSDVPVRFSEDEAVTIPPGAIVLSDPVDLAVSRGDELSLSARFEAAVDLADTDRRAALPGWIEDARGARTQSPESALFSTLYVAADPATRVLAILSDTKSAGPGSWAEMLVDLLPTGIGVVNRSLYAGHLALGPPGLGALARLERDVLSVPGITDVLLFAGNNDLIQPGMVGSSGAFSLDPSLMQSTAELTGYLAHAARLVRARGMRAGAATWLPYEGVTIAEGYSTPEKQRIRGEVNAWLRTTAALDWVVDFDEALRDPAAPTRLDARFDEGNHFTPNAAGYARMAQVMADRLRN